MGDTSNDPIDHQRTSRPRVGQTLKSPAKTPGLVLLAAGLVAFGVAVAGFAYGRTSVGTVAAVIALLAFGAGGLWLTAEARRVRKLDVRHSDDPGRER